MSETPAVYLTARLEETGDIDNLDEDFPVPSFEGPGGEIQPAVILDEMAAERHLKAISWYQHETRRIRDHAAAHRARIDAWEQARLRPVEGRIVWHEGGLRAFLTRSGKKAMKLAYGSMKFTTPGESLKVLDEHAALKWATPLNLVRMKVEVSAADVKAWIKANGGEIPPGMDIVTGEEKFKVEVA